MGSGGKDDFTEDEVTLTARLGEEWSAGTGEAVLPEPPEAVAMGETSQEASVLPRNTCSAPRKLDRFSLEFPVVWNLAGRRQKDASIEVHGRAEGVHYQAG
ncbi:hypothetical protein MACH15_09420 [Maricaulis maris]|nr:hypothetical protein MACH15_09420 [Maricaulis maris]